MKRDERTAGDSRGRSFTYTLIDILIPRSRGLPREGRAEIVVQIRGVPDSIQLPAQAIGNYLSPMGYDIRSRKGLGSLCPGFDAPRVWLVPLLISQCASSHADMDPWKNCANPSIYQSDVHLLFRPSRRSQSLPKNVSPAQCASPDHRNSAR